MLKRLHIQNYAIIEEITIGFSGGMNIITGETGAGKSILMGALSLILGDRADTTVLLNREKKCFVEGYFDITAQEAILQYLHDQDLDAETELLIRREITTNGKSRAFVNDTPVNLEQLRHLSSMLVDLHRQFDTLELGESGFQMEVIDALASNKGLLKSYQSKYRLWLAEKSKLADLNETKEQFNKEFDYNKFQFDELAEAGFKDNELEDMEAELKLLSNAEGIHVLLAKITNELNDGEEPLVPKLKSLCNQLAGYTSYHGSLSELHSRLQSVQIELQDIGAEAEHVNEQFQFDPLKIEKYNERISQGYRLLKKHGVKTTRDLLEIRATLEAKLDAVLNIDELIAATEKMTASLFNDCSAIARQLSDNRKKKQKSLETQVNKLLVQVGMPNARLKVDIQTCPLNLTGEDRVEFLFDANLSDRFEPVRKVASGGELSRLMLCIKSLVAQSVDLGTLIFDEIDTGISGEAAKQVGIIMKQLGSNRQLIAITHQPQIAGKADAHYFVYKEIRGNSIYTNIRQLTQDERITAIARMLSGEKPTAAAMENAREMVMN
ncbi:MAG TPA: DNA repair protein RecN [Flavitalea sp.]|nr:DNA repair protein RecN [Flavitalea sp.]